MLYRKLLVTTCSLTIGLAACAGTDGTDGSAGEKASRPPRGKADQWVGTGGSITFEEFEAHAYCEPDADVCIIDGDIPVAGGADGLREYYDQHVGGGRSALTVNEPDGLAARWPRAERFNLTYCVSDILAARKDDAIEAMSRATARWEEFAHVDFRYVEGVDCDMKTDAVLFPVVDAPADAPYIARSFFPDSGDDERQLRINFAAFDHAKDGRDDAAENMTLPGTLRHELGHILGFRHEHIRPENDFQWCDEDGGYRPLTEYDSKSVMHYPQCGGDGDWSLTLTETDQQGAQFFYPDYERFPLGRCDQELDADGHVRAECRPVAHQIVEFVNSASRPALDDWAGLDRRAVDGIMATRARHPFHSLADLEEVSYLKGHGVRKLYDYLYVDGRCPTEVDGDGRPAATCRPVANAIVSLANTASQATLDGPVGLDRRAAENIVEARRRQRFDSLAGLWEISYVKTRALSKLYHYLYE